MSRHPSPHALQLAALLLVDALDADTLIGDLEELWAANRDAAGARRANRWLWREVARSAPWWLWMRVSGWSRREWIVVSAEAVMGCTVAVLSVFGINWSVSRFVVDAATGGGCVAFVALSLAGCAATNACLGWAYYARRSDGPARSSVAALVLGGGIVGWVVSRLGRAPASYLFALALIIACALVAGTGLGLARSMRFANAARPRAPS